MHYIEAMKKKFLTYALALSIFFGGATAPKANALIIGLTIWTTARIFGHRVSFATFCFGGPTPVILGPGGGPGGAQTMFLLLLVGIALDEDAKNVTQSMTTIDTEDLTEKVNAGLYTDAEAKTISKEITALNNQPTQRVEKIEFTGKTGLEFAHLVQTKLGVSELTASYLAAKIGIQTEK